MLNFYVRHGLIVDEFHEKIAFRQTKRLEKNLNCNTQKRNQATDDFGKGFYNLLNNSFYGKTMENSRRRVKRESVGKDDDDKMVKWQSKFTY